jgi:DNA-binding Lrp family transcriptional regulator
MAETQLDSTDRSILMHLQRDGRLSNVELAQRVHLSPSACLRRVKQLEESGVIACYVALLSAKAVGRQGTSYTIINLEGINPARLQAFEQAVRDASNATTLPARTTTCCVLPTVMPTTWSASIRQC